MNFNLPLKQCFLRIYFYYFNSVQTLSDWCRSNYSVKNVHFFLFLLKTWKVILPFFYVFFCKVLLIIVLISKYSSVQPLHFTEILCSSLPHSHSLIFHPFHHTLPPNTPFSQKKLPWVCGVCACNNSLYSWYHS